MISEDLTGRFTVIGMNERKKALAEEFLPGIAEDLEKSRVCFDEFRTGAVRNAHHVKRHGKQCVNILLSSGEQSFGSFRPAVARPNACSCVRYCLLSLHQCMHVLVPGSGAWRVFQLYHARAVTAFRRGAVLSVSGRLAKPSDFFVS